MGGGGGVSYRTLWTPMRQPELRAAVVLVHGYGAHGGVWAPIAQRLALGHCAVCALDLQGASCPRAARGLPSAHRLLAQGTAAPGAGTAPLKPRPRFGA